MSYIYFFNFIPIQKRRHFIHWNEMASFKSLEIEKKNLMKHHRSKTRLNESPTPISSSRHLLPQSRVFVSSTSFLHTLMTKSWMTLLCHWNVTTNRRPHRCMSRPILLVFSPLVDLFRPVLSTILQHLCSVSLAPKPCRSHRFSPLVALNRFVSRSTDKCLPFLQSVAKSLKLGWRVQSSIWRPQKVPHQPSIACPTQMQGGFDLVPICLLASRLFSLGTRQWWGPKTSILH